jgi:ribosomal-protein-alanine N-acetyltransferase
VSDWLLDSERLVLRPLTPDDLDRLCGILADPEIVKMLLGDISSAEGVEKEARKWIDDADFWQRNRFGSWGIHDGSGTIAPGDALLGIVAASPPLGSLGQGPEIFYFLKREFWGRGIAGEAASRVCRYLFDDLKAPAVEASIFAEANPGSVRVARKLGMRPAGRISLRDHGLDDGRIAEIVRFDIWRVRTAPAENLHQTVSEAAFRVGQTVAEGFGAAEGRKAEFLQTLAARDDAVQIDRQAFSDRISAAMERGTDAKGLALYRVLREEFRH